MTQKSLMTQMKQSAGNSPIQEGIGIFGRRVEQLQL